MAWHQKPKGKVDLAREQAKVGSFMDALANQWAFLPAAKTKQLETQAEARRIAHRQHYG